MNIHLHPEREEMIEQDVRRGRYQAVDEFREHAISLLHEQESRAFLADISLAGGIRQDLATLPVRFRLVQPYRKPDCLPTREQVLQLSGSSIGREIFRPFCGRRKQTLFCKNQQGLIS